MRRSGRRWLFLMVVLVASTSLLWLPPAQADLKRNNHFVFRGKINHKDPVNLLWFGGSNNSPECSDKDSDCMKRNFSYWDHMFSRVCNGGNDGRLKMHKTGGGPLINPKNDAEVSGSRTCKKQYHARIWDDTDHGHGSHVWGLSPIHHENRPACCSGHKIDRHWEIAEFDAKDNLGHGSGKFCTYRDWRPLPGSGGKIKGWYSDGYITRISFHRHAGSATCSGA